jgi:hypothetical protein
MDTMDKKIINIWQATIIINDQLTSHFKCKKGLKQGDPFFLI